VRKVEKRTEKTVPARVDEQLFTKAQGRLNLSFCSETLPFITLDTVNNWV